MRQAAGDEVVDGAMTGEVGFLGQEGDSGTGLKEAAAAVRLEFSGQQAQQGQKPQPGQQPGDQQAQGHAQVLVNMIDFGANIQAASDAARFNHNQRSNKLQLESELFNVIGADMKAWGHDVASASGAGGPVRALPVSLNLITGGLLPIAASRNGSIW